MRINGLGVFHSRNLSSMAYDSSDRNFVAPDVFSEIIKIMEINKIIKIIEINKISKV